MSNWNSAAITRAAEAVREAMHENLRSEFVLAKVLGKLKSALDDGEFVRFLMDCESGLGLSNSTAYKYERMVSAVKVVPNEPVWEKVGWGGVNKVVQIENRNERVAVCRAIVREPSTVSKHALIEIMADKAPSYSAQRGSRGSGGGGITKTQALRERDVLASTLTQILKDYAVIRREWLTDEIRTILGLEDQKSQAG